MAAAIDILLVEDNQDDLELTLSVLKKNSPSTKVEVCRDGAEALEFLFGEGAYANRDLTNQPRLILLDIKLPKLDGLQVLGRVRKDERTQQIPVVMLTSSSRKADLDSAYKGGANSYLVKSVNYRQFTQDIIQLCEYWLVLNRGSSSLS